VKRSWVWGGLGLLVLASSVFGYQHRETAAAPVMTPGPPALYGIRGTDTRVDPLLPGGTGTVCVEEGFATQAQGWRCLAWAVNERNVPVVAPPQYQGACTHLLADTTRARWLCLGTYPYSPSELPPSS
jgi:hypothetical protein